MKGENMGSIFFIFLALLLSIVNSAPGSYQYVSFIRNGAKTKPTSIGSHARSYDLGLDDLFSATPVWGDEIVHPVTNSLTFEENRGHITPDFTNGLSYPDPLLLTGLAAKHAADYLYRKPLFFEDIKHLRQLYHNQEIRRANGLAGNKLGSLRRHLPFYRFKKEHNFFSN